ncbi:rRNA adenine N-6-methyltransferase [Staphylococcus aureus subsp. aureus CIG547]|nr:rRNA adenine N-6-methyltransferase [Staphylococcus aureus subsp. aureus CIG547]
MNHTNISKQDNVIEIGSGKGHFTKELVKMSRSVTAIEIDGGLCQVTKEAVNPSENIKVIQTDILKFSFPKHINYKIYGNIPYNISTDIVQKKLPLKVRLNIAILSLRRDLRKRLQKSANELWVYY